MATPVKNRTSPDSLQRGAMPFLPLPKPKGPVVALEVGGRPGRRKTGLRRTLENFATDGRDVNSFVVGGPEWALLTLCCAQSRGQQWV